MPKAPKASQNSSDANVKQITDFFPRKSVLAQSTGSSASRPKNAKQGATKENTTPHGCNPHSKTQSDNEPSLNSAASSVPCRAVSPVPTKAVSQITSPMQPSTKRLRSQSATTSRPTKQTKRTKNILCDSTFEEDIMDVDEDSVVYVPMTAVPAPPPSVSPFLQVAPSDPRMGVSPDLQSELSQVPSSVSDEKELESSHLERKDVEVVRDAIDHWRQQALPPSPQTTVNSPVEFGTPPQSDTQPSAEADLGMSNESSSSTTPSRPNVITTTSASIPTPPSTGGPDDILPLSPVKVLDTKAKTEQIIRDIKARAFAQSLASEPSSPLSEIASLDSSDDEDGDYDGLAMLGLNDQLRARSPVKAKSPVKPTKYNLRNPAAKPEVKSEPSFPSRRDTSPSPTARRKSTINPLDALLKEKRTIDARSSMTSTDREARLHDLANMNLDDYDKEEDEDKVVNTNGPVSGADDGNPFIDENQKQQVMDIFKGDRDIEDEEEHLRQLGRVGVALWGPLESDAMNDSEVTFPSLEYQGSDPTLQTFAETVARGDHGLIRLLMQSGVLELANYNEGGSTVIEYLTNLAISCREDDLDLSALRLLPHILCNDQIASPVLLFERILFTLCIFGAEPSALERHGWTVQYGQRRGVCGDVRLKVIERLVFCITEVAKSGHLQRREIPDIVVVLLLFGMEPSLPEEMRLQVSSTIHTVCQSLGQEGNVDIDTECAIVNKVLRLVQPYSLQNKLHTVNLVANTAGRAARIARSIAHAMLTDKSALLPSQYTPLPPISELLAMLNVSTPDAPRPTGKFEIHEATDYVDMACWAGILAIAMTDLAPYMELEESAKASAGTLFKTSLGEKEESIFESFYSKMIRIHNRIQDTRAAHLDRSQTKSVLHLTAHRILYQSQSIAQHRRKRSAKLQSYFTQK